MADFQSDSSTAEFIEFAGRGEFLLRRSTLTGAVYGPQVTSTEDTPAVSMESVVAGGHATVVSYTIVYGRPGPDGVAPRTVLAIGELEEGPWWWAEVEGADPETIAIGASLRIGFRDIDDGQRVPVFVAA